MESNPYLSESMSVNYKHVVLKMSNLRTMLDITAGKEIIINQQVKTKQMVIKLVVF